MHPIRSSTLRWPTLLRPAPTSACCFLGRAGAHFFRFCAGFILILTAALAEDVVFFREYGSGPEQPSELTTDGTAYYVVGGALPSYSAIPGVATPGFLRKLDAEGNE